MLVTPNLAANYLLWCAVSQQLSTTLYYLPSLSLKSGLTSTNRAKGKRIWLNADKTSSKTSQRNYCRLRLWLYNSCSPNSPGSSNLSVYFYLTALNTRNKSRPLRSTLEHYSFYMCVKTVWLLYWLAVVICKLGELTDKGYGFGCSDQLYHATVDDHAVLWV